MFSLVSRGEPANSAAIQPRFRTIFVLILLRSASVMSGKARHRLKSAVFRSFGRRKKKDKREMKPKRRGPLGGGNDPIACRIVHAAANSSHSLITVHDGTSIA